ncbi:MAG: hypothetical protein K2R98_19780 [Gemmataceae bacterium]|nr:hypothetical protein [Gemmataceae bacterium]
MTLENKLLQKLSKWKLSGSHRQDLVVVDGESGWTATLSAERCDDLGCLVWELALQRSTPLVADASELRAWANRATSRVTGLLEPLRLVEVDGSRLEAQLRSQTPTARDDRRFYYEVLLRANGLATVRRYQASQPSSHHREQVGFALTHEVLAKLAADLTAEK